MPRSSRLSQAVQVALENNRPVNIAKLDIDKSKWTLAQTKTKRFPGDHHLPVCFGRYHFADVHFPGGKLWSNEAAKLQALQWNYRVCIGASSAAALAALPDPSGCPGAGVVGRFSGEQYKGKRQSLAASVKQAYYAALQTESALEAAQALVKQYEETDRVAQQYLAQESVLKSDSLEVKAKLAQARYQIVQLRDTLDTQKEQVNELLGRDIDTPFRTEPVPPITPAEMDLKVARQTALQQRPEVKEAEIDTRRADYDRKLSQGEIHSRCRRSHPLPRSDQHRDSAAEYPLRRDGTKMGSLRLGRTQGRSETEGCERAAKPLPTAGDAGAGDAGRRQQLPQVRREPVACWLWRRPASDAADEKLREVSDQFKHSAVLLRDVLQQQASVANADHEYEQSLLAFWNAKACI